MKKRTIISNNLHIKNKTTQNDNGHNGIFEIMKQSIRGSLCIGLLFDLCLGKIIFFQTNGQSSIIIVKQAIPSSSLI